MPSSSARCAWFPHAQDKVRYYTKLKDLRDQLKDDVKKMSVKEEKYDPGYKAAYQGSSCDRAPYESEQRHFSSNGTAVNPQCCEGSSFGEVPNGQRMSQSFAEQIPEFGAGLTRE